MAEWLIRVIGKQRKDINIDLVVQAVIALGHQLAEEARQTPQPMTTPSDAADDDAWQKPDGAA